MEDPDSDCVQLVGKQTYRETGDCIKMCTYSKTKEQSLDVHVLDLQSSLMESLWTGSQKHHVGFSYCDMLIGTVAAVSELTVLASGQNKQDELSLLGHYFGDKFLVGRTVAQSSSSKVGQKYLPLSDTQITKC